MYELQHRFMFQNSRDLRLVYSNGRFLPDDRAREVRVWNQGCRGQEDIRGFKELFR